MATEIQTLDTSNIGLVKDLVSEMFSPESFAIIEQSLANPLLKEMPEVSPGEVVIQDGKPVAFRMAVLRRLYRGTKSFIGVVGSTLCSKKGTNPGALVGLLRRNTASRGGSRIFFTNTSCEASGKLNRAVGVKGIGPELGEADHVRILRPFAAVLYMMRKLLRLPMRKVAIPQRLDFNTTIGRVSIRRVENVPAQAINDLWSRYLRTNKGLVCSRQAEELEWMFGERLASGELVLLLAECSEVAIGYVVISLNSEGSARVLDILAVNNDHDILLTIFKGAVRFLKKKTPILLFKIAGYPPGHAEVFEKIFPRKRPFGYNPSLYKIEKDFDLTETEMRSSDSWFFGPYDGDLAMG